MEKKRILIVDDEETLCEALKFNLVSHGYDADTALSAEEALALSLDSYDLILLDIMMGEISGIQLAKILKGNPSTAHIPIIFCTAKGEEDDMIEGLHLGADDYISKPYSLRNILARVEAVLRRSANASSRQSSSWKGLSLNPDDKSCMVDGEPVYLNRKEYEILSLLLKNSGRVLSREEILSGAWPGDVIVAPRVVDVNVARIRQKIGVYSKNLISRAGYGYGFIPQD